VAYGIQTFPTRGPFPVEFLLAAPQDGDKTKAGSVVYVVYDIPFQYRDSEISGFYFCPLSALECDASYILDTWQEVAKENVMQVDDRTVLVDISSFDTLGTLGYLWRETPVLTYLGLPIYAADEYQLPSPPWKFQLN